MTKWKLVPVEPDESQWGGLARKIIMAWDMGSDTPRKLFSYLGATGKPIPQWLQDEPEMQNLDHVPSKGTRAAIIYRAMLEAAPPAPEPDPVAFMTREGLVASRKQVETNTASSLAASFTIPLYTAPPVPSVPDGWRGLTDVEWMNIVNFDSAYSSYDKEWAVNEAVKRTEAKLKELNAAQQQEPPADLVRDAERWDKYMYLIGINSDKAAEILDIVDAAIERDKQKGQS